MKNILSCFLSAFLLRLSFPPWDLWGLAWAGLVPFLGALEGKRPRAAFGLGWWTGLLFFGSTLWWFIHVTLPGMALLVMYLSLYFALFGLCSSLFSHRLSPLARMFFLPSLWVALEYLRGWIFTGFGWVTLGHSQYKNLVMIQIADITGLYGVSFLVVMVNVLLKDGCKVFFGRKKAVREFVFPATLGLFLEVMAAVYGAVRLHSLQVSPGPLVAVIQANIAQSEKWERSRWPGIMKKYRDLTGEAAEDHPDLILWPETAFPGFVWEAPDLFSKLKNDVRNFQIPLLLGAVTQSDDEYYNSAFLIEPSGAVGPQYDKLHLVPFGEYVPLRGIFPFLSDIVPIGDFTPGKEYTLFQLPLKEEKGSAPRPAGGAQSPFGVLICFEDTVSPISRRFTQNGAQFLVNITNDAWFLDTPAPWMHLQASVFRAVENRRTLIRAANTGVSAFVDPRGRVTRFVENLQGKKTFVEGSASARVTLSHEKTFYTKSGDIFAYFCFGCILGGILGASRRFKP